ncbi:hypothetical protein RZO55_02895 [Clostridium boliviensis]|uniref:Uncharacterized protein n=1 Tax=Clostridium boliviensis TaxID=318465 RepID=A0ABU4GHU7_9CLOT|nr:hypothetical protein [Clostridium boliviensis]MDW2796528.1 hypothetical protein [Clostridium boliviensis]
MEKTDVRSYWLNSMLKISLPVLENLANDTLKERLPNTNPKCHKNALLLTKTILRREYVCR